MYWKVLKKFLDYEKVDSNTPRDVLKKAFQFQLINDEAIWLSMLDDRNTTSNVYREEIAQKVFENIRQYFPVFKKTYEALKTRYNL